MPEVVRQPLNGGGYLLMVHGSPRDLLEQLTHGMSDEALAHAAFIDDAGGAIKLEQFTVPLGRAQREIGAAVR
ncbi:MAG: hypothetical protein EXR75_00870 [Myxococcales bacterium]|nr:hypothetical protein [Myxococcales bacterium]